MVGFGKLAISGLLVSRVVADCAWTSQCGPRGCDDCKDDGSPGYKECCSSGNCGWVSQCGPRGCADCKDDGSPGYKQCCGPSPGPTPGPSPGPTALYCPSANDIVVTYGSPQIHNQGWTVHGNGGVGTKSAYNLIGGWVEYDIDFSSVQTGINANIYTVSPHGIGASGYQPSSYCDGAATGSKWCVEVDWVESNGNCGGATTLHTREGPGNDGCSAWGCRNSYHYNGKSKFHMRIEYGNDGSWTTIRDGQVIGGGQLNPTPGGNEWNILKQAYESQGAVIISTEWKGWVPVEDCGSGGDLDSSSFTVSNLKIQGSVKQGPTPTLCGGVQQSASIVV